MSSKTHTFNVVSIFACVFGTFQFICLFYKYFILIMCARALQDSFVGWHWIESLSFESIPVTFRSNVSRRFFFVFSPRLTSNRLDSTRTQYHSNHIQTECCVVQYSLDSTLSCVAPIRPIRRPIRSTPANARSSEARAASFAATKDRSQSSD